MVASARAEFNGDVILNVPPSARQKRLALGAVVILFVGLGAAAPFAATPLPRATAFVPSLNAALSVTNLITAILIFGHFSAYRSPALLVLANGYLFTAAIVIPHALTFPGAFSPAGLLGAGPQTTAWLYVFWHLGFPSALLGYAFLKDKELNIRGTSQSVIWKSACITIGLVCGFVLLTILGDPFLPRLFLDAGRLTPLGGYAPILTLMYCASALVALWTRRRSVLDMWLMVVACALIGELALTIVRFSLGFYVSRVFSLATSSIVLAMLLVQIIRLYANVVDSNATLRRERNNKLMNLEAMSVAIAHEVRQPLAAIAMNSEAVLAYLENARPGTLNREDVRSALTDIIDDSHRTGDIFSNIRMLFTKQKRDETAVDFNDVILRVLRILRAELMRHDIVVKTELATDLPLVMGQEGQLQEVVINLIQNAIDAMASAAGRARVLQIRTRTMGDNEIAISVADSGPGIARDKLGSVFDAFITTKESGIGLGLAICRMIVERHGGTISASSGANGGAHFEMIFPVETATVLGIGRSLAAVT